MIGHTPGPWIVRGGYSIYAADRKTPVADACLTNSVPANDEANALLIAAAPELLEALKKLVENITETRGPNADEALQNALSIIAKATTK